MTENEENRVLASTAIFADTLEEIQKAANQIKKRNPSARKPSAAKVIDMAWQLYRKLGDAVAHAGSLGMETRVGVGLHDADAIVALLLRNAVEQRFHDSSSIDQDNAVEIALERWRSVLEDLKHSESILREVIHRVEEADDGKDHSARTDKLVQRSAKARERAEKTLNRTAKANQAAERAIEKSGRNRPADGAHPAGDRTQKKAEGEG